MKQKPQDAVQHSMLQLSLLHRALDTQSSLNERLRIDWQSQDWPYLRAAMVEAVECLTHTNWAWWKANTYEAQLSHAQQQQLHLECVDIFHFILCEALQQIHEMHDEGRDDYVEKVATSRMQVCQTVTASFRDTWTTRKHLGDERYINIENAVEGLVESILAAGKISQLGLDGMAGVLCAFARLCVNADLPLDGLLVLYFAKNTLNQFRWDNGYQTGTYRKMWLTADPQAPAVEDNVILGQGLTAYVESAGDRMLAYVNDGVMQLHLYDFLNRRYTAQQ